MKFLKINQLNPNQLQIIIIINISIPVTAFQFFSFSVLQFCIYLFLKWHIFQI